VERGALPPGEIPEFDVEVPSDPRHGDYATNAAMVLARATGLKPGEIASAIEAYAPAKVRISQVSIAGPGFINLTAVDPRRV
jgi:arginyl-tRNA synthetase